jgi:hypothetical protein
MLLELGKAISLLLSVLSLYPVLFSAFFVPGAGWQERLLLSLGRLALSGCICFASGLVFLLPTRQHNKAERSLLSTLPVQIFIFAVGIMVLLFLVAWYLDVYYMPHLWRNEPG